MMKESNLISIIVPVYGVEEYLDRCVESLVKQTYKNIEIILVDDGSPDNCPLICDKWAKEDNRVRVVHQSNKGAAAAKNTGLRIATGSLIAFCDADDYVDRKMLQTMFECMMHSESDIVTCGVNWVDDGNQILFIEKSEDRELFQPEAMKGLLECGVLKEQVWDKLYKRQCIGDAEFVEQKKIDDVFWTYKVIGNAKKTAIMSIPLYYYMQRDSSVMGAGYQDYWMDTIEAYQKRCEYIKNNYPELYNLSVSSLIGTCMYHVQMALKTGRNQEQIERIIIIINSWKDDMLFDSQISKQRIWLWLFLHFPIVTCRLRNKLKVGI